MPVVIDFHVLAQAVVYFISVACGLVISIPLGVTTVKFHGNCLLYTEITWTNATFFTAAYSSGPACYFPVYLSVFIGILFASGMGVYYVYAVTRKDPNIGSQMWVLPFTLINSVSAVTFFIAACMISVGMKVMCDGYTEGKFVTSCAEADKARWNPSDPYDSSTLYEYIKASEGAAWVMVLVWVVQMALGILRIVRNRRLRSQGMFAEGDAPGSKKTEDLRNVVGEQPTA
ncbi:transmembrane protein 179B-like [Babylonia areolata]|uniref:transmembrane protein 179B-like n=1 Tax=Babylonia areolata TaxID=304850 RepID=UPI003FD15A29